MLTHHDVTVSNALEVLEEVKDTGLRFIGCKDVGLSLNQYVELFNRIRKYGLTSFLEVVTYSEEEHFKGVNLALKVGVDNLIGGMPQYTRKTLEYLREKKSKIKYFPYIGKIVDHPCILQGSIEEIINDGKEAEALGVNGINLLLYRYTGNQKTLLNKAVKELKVPLIVAGNVTTFNQIEELKKNNIWAFTIGGAIFEKKFAEKGDIQEQIMAVLSKIK
jgi:2,4-dienoyl-CoA reductase-like NADH-dependent reductase (Old Yellow Enzyme family)